jgi:carboxypeptidase family protein
MLTGYVYEVMLPGAGEPPISEVLITVTAEAGEASSSRTDDAGFYSVRAATGPVVVTASKDGYRTRQARFDMTDSTVLNFSLRPAAD